MKTQYNTIKKNLEEFLSHLPDEKRSIFLLENTSLLAVIHGSKNDEAVLSKAKQSDEKHGTDLFDQVIQLRAYCSTCCNLQCTCNT